MLADIVLRFVADVITTLCNKIKGIQLQQDEGIMSYDVKALFTSMPIGIATKIIQDQQEQDKELKQRISMSVNNIYCLLEFCLRKTYFLLQHRYYEQLEGAIGVTHKFHSSQFVHWKFWSQSPQHITPPPSLWKRYVDDILWSLNSTQKWIPGAHLLHRPVHTDEATRTDGPMSLLDTLVIPQPDSSLETTVYMKPTYTGQYLH